MTRRYELLDGMRGIAALAVMTLHAAAQFKFAAPLAYAGLSVDFFFCLSGFVIAASYDGKVGVQYGFGRFLKMRTIRLYPMILAGVALGLIAALLAGAQPLHTISLAALGAVLLPNVVAALAYPINYPMWSLLFEGFANVAYGLERGRLGNRTMIFGTALCGLLLVILIGIGGQVFHFGTGGGWKLILGLPRVVYPFFLGVLIHRLALIQRAPRIPPLILAAVLVAILAMPFQHWTYDAAMVVAALPALVLLGAAAEPSKLDPVWKYLGRLSYPLYLVHAPVMKVVFGFTSDWPPVIAGAWACVASIAVGHVALTLYDEPVRDWLKGVSGRYTTSSVTSTP